MRLLLLRQPRRRSRIRLGRQPFTARNPTGRQIYLYLHQSGFLRSFSTGSRLDNRRRRWRLTSPLLPFNLPSSIVKTQEGWERMVDMNSLEGRLVAKRKPTFQMSNATNV